MRIMVLDVAAESGGALTVLKHYYEKAVDDCENEYIFVISTPEFRDTKNIKVLKYPWVKKSWFHRLYFDRFIAKKIALKYKFDEILSLQNLIIRGVGTRQVLYLHQSLPFIEKKYRVTENFKFWVYQNIIGRMIIDSVRKADKVIVQTNWMKEACVEKAGLNDSGKFEIEPPQLNIRVKKYYCNGRKKMFFYPASALEYKNHKIIVEAVKKLVFSGIRDFEVIFTVRGDENRYIKSLYKTVQKYGLPVYFIGYIDLEKVYEYYTKSILVFPSYVETFGLPLLEAKLHKSPILAADCAFAHEILDDYDNVQFFNPFDEESLIGCMQNFLLNS